MKKTFLPLIVLFLLISACCKAQQVDTLQQKAKVDFWQKKLQINQSTAKQAVVIMDDYKKNVSLVMADVNISDDRKRNRIDSLIQKKISKLKLILTTDQLQKSVPSTEISIKAQ